MCSNTERTKDMIRFILVCITVIGYLVLTIPVLLIEWIIGKFAPMKKDISSLRMVQAIFKFILWLTGARVTVIGEENVPKDQPAFGERISAPPQNRRWGLQCPAGQCSDGRFSSPAARQPRPGDGTSAWVRVRSDWH